MLERARFDIGLGYRDFFAADPSLLLPDAADFSSRSANNFIDTARHQ
jgi:hypothetical protein